MKKIIYFLGLLAFISSTITISIVYGLYTPRTINPPVIDGAITGDEWVGAPQLELPHGYMVAKHDNEYIYILIDLVGDPGEDNPPPPNDYFWLTFDVDQDGAITSGVDLNYGLLQFTQTLAVQQYLGPGTWTGAGPTSSILGVGFGPSHNSAVDHRFWELAIDKQEVEAENCRLARVGVRMNSTYPSFTDDVPPDFRLDFSELIELSDCQPVAGELLPENLASTYLAGILVAITTAALVKRQ
jgi:hypothetical protein